MVYIRSLLSFVGLFALVAHAYPSSTFQDKCSGLAGQIQLNYTFDVNIAAYLPANGTIDYVAEGLNETCLDTQAFPIPVGVCRLNLRIATSDSSETYMEVWLPENYSGRTLTTGNGGLAGCMCFVRCQFLSALFSSELIVGVTMPRLTEAYRYPISGARVWGF